MSIVVLAHGTAILSVCVCIWILALVDALATADDATARLHGMHEPIATVMLLLNQ